MPRRRRDGSFQQRLLLESMTERAEKEGYRVGASGLISVCQYSEKRPSMVAAWRRGYRRGIALYWGRQANQGAGGCRA